MNLAAEQSLLDPPVLYPAQMANQSGDSHQRGSGQRCQPGVLVGQPGALGVHSVARVVQHGSQDRALVPANGDVVGSGSHELLCSGEGAAMRRPAEASGMLSPQTTAIAGRGWA